MRARCLGIGAAIALGVCAGDAGADSISASLGQPLQEIAHDVEVTVSGGVATFKVRRAIRNEGGTPEEAVLVVAMPPGAAATGLRIKARDRWYEAELLEAEDAAKRYLELTGFGQWRPKDPALLAWVSAGTLSLQLFPVFPGGTSTVEYTLVAPTRYGKGRRVTYYPDAEPASGMAAPRIRGPAGAVLTGGVIDVDGPDEEDGDEDDESGTTSSLARGDAASFTRIDVPAAPIATAAARYGAAPVAMGRTVLRFELDVAAVLEAAPRRAHVVFVVDASHSEGDDGIAAQLALVHAYLAELPDAQVEVVAFHRRAERLFGRFVPAGDAGRLLRELAPRRLVPGNGSHLDAGLAEAAGALRGVGGPTRIVAMTDALLRAAFTAPAAIDALRGAPAGTIVHVVVRDGLAEAGDAPAEARDDQHPLAPIAASRGGVLLDVTGGWDNLGLLRRIARGLVRPVRIDNVVADAPGTGDDGLAIPSTLHEGTGVQAMVLAAAAPPTVTVRGQIWGRPFARVVAVDPAYSRTTAALLFGDGLVDSLEPDELMRAARTGRAVSPVTSYLAIEPGTRPSTAGIDRSGEGTIGDGRYGVGSGHGGMSGHFAGPSADPAAILRAQLEALASACLARHEVGAFQGTVTVETTGTEIVDVRVPDVASPLGACVVEATWRIDVAAIAGTAAGAFPDERTAYAIDVDVRRAASDP